MANCRHSCQRCNEEETWVIDFPAYIKPVCFPTMKLYVEWKECARIAQEPCTICDDCSGRYQYLMKIQDKCKPDIWNKHKFGKDR